MSAVPAARGRAWIALAVLCAGTILVFLPLRHAEFLNYDDPHHVTQNPFTRSGFTLEGLAWAFTSAVPNWNPLTWLSHMLDAQLFGLNAGAHHMSALLLHVANGALLFWALWRMTGDLGPSLFVAALFAVHPLHVEPVAWISARPHLLSGLLWMGATLGYVRYTERRTVGRYAPVVACMLLDLVNRGFTVTLPLALLLLDYWPLRRWPAAGPDRAGARTTVRTLLVEKLPLFAIAAADVFAQVAGRAVNRSLVPVDDLPLPVRAANGLANYGVYAWKTIWPSGLALPYPLQPGFPPTPRLLLSILFLAATSAAVAVLGRRRRYLATGWLWYLVTLLPVAGFVPIGHQAMADRYTYVPLVGLFAAVAWAGADAVRAGVVPRRAAGLAAGAVVIVFAVVARIQVGYFHDSLSLFSHAVAVTGPNAVATESLAVALEGAGRRDEARETYERALRINPNVAVTHANLGALLMEDGRIEEAETLLREALRLEPGLLPVRVYLGEVRLRRGDAAGATGLIRPVVALQPAYTRARFSLAQALEAEGRSEEALAEYGQAARLDPASADVRYRLAALEEKTGRTTQALEHYRDVLRIDPRHEPSRAALARLGAGG